MGVLVWGTLDLDRTMLILPYEPNRKKQILCGEVFRNCYNSTWVKNQKLYTSEDYEEPLCETVANQETVAPAC
jgi:hypothetical protein